MPPDKGWFFDSAAVLARVDAARRRVLSRMGAFVRTRARSLLRYRAKPSAPGSPPSVHRAGGFARTIRKKDGSTVRRPCSPLKELVYFGYDPARDTVVVGPALFRAAASRTRPAAGTVPGLIEGGGSAVRRDPGGRTVTVKARRGGTFETRTRGGTRVLTYRPRPFMSKALELERDKFPGEFRGEVGG